MSATTSTESPAGAPPSEPNAGNHKTPNTSMRRFGHVAAAYWAGHRRSWLLVVGIAFVLASTLAVNVALNYWNRVFFDAIGSKDIAAVYRVLIWLPVLIVVGASLAAVMGWLKQTLQLDWRAFLTREYLARWLGEQRYYRLALSRSSIQNVEHRIAEDVRLMTEPAVELTVGLIWSMANSLVFLGVLLTVGGSLEVGAIEIPGFMALAALLYAAIVTGAVMWIGNRMTRFIADKNEQEAQFRYELTRVRENAESIAFLRGDEREQQAAQENFAGLAEATRQLVWQNAKVTWVLNAHAFLAPAVPAVLAAPKFMSGELTLGAVMQLVAAFASVLGALNWISDNFVRLAELKAAINRSTELHNALEEVDAYRSEGASSALAHGHGSADIELRNVTLRKQDGSLLVERANVRVTPGERILIEGKSGSGKSTLLRMLAGFWPWAEGRFAIPADAKIAFIPQRPYIPIGRLIDALSYPADRAVDAAAAAQALEKVRLAHFVDKLDEQQSWDTILSGGERQRLAFARILVDKPDIVVLDEATSALDDEGQASIFETLLEELPDATILNVAHRPGLLQYHDRKLTIGKDDGRPKLESRALTMVRLDRMANAVRRGVARISGGGSSTP